MTKTKISVLQIVLLPISLFSWNAIATAREPEYYPPEVKNQAWGLPLEGPSFFVPGALNGYKARYRLTVTGISCRAVSVRIDQRRNGGVKAYSRSIWKRTCPGRNRLPEASERFVAADRLDKLEQEMATAKLWTLPVEFWELADPGDALCIDGNQLILERLDSLGYRVALANAQCTATQEILLVAKSMLQMAGTYDALRLLN